jgi:hypothetical protein
MGCTAWPICTSTSAAQRVQRNFRPGARVFGWLAGAVGQADNMNEQPLPLPSTNDGSTPGSLDGDGAGDHDQPFNGYRPYQFGTRQIARLLGLRGVFLEARLGNGPWAQDLAAAA